MNLKEKCQLRRLIQSEMKKAFQKFSPDTGYLTIRRVIEVYGVSRGHIYSLRERGLIKFHYLTERKPFIKRSEIEGLIKPEVIHERQFIKRVIVDDEGKELLSKTYEIKVQANGIQGEAAN